MFAQRSALRILAITIALFAASLVLAPAVQSQPSPAPARTILDAYVAEAIGANLALAQQQAQLARANAQVREARGRFLPSLDVNARYSEVSGVVNIGDFINPAYNALNQLIGQPRFPTNINATLPFKQESKLELTLPIFNDAIGAATAAARAQRDLVGAGRHAAMRQLAADVQLAWLGYASLDQAVATLEATLPLLDENVRVSTRLIDAGQATPDALLRARAERSEVQQQLDDTRRQRAAAQRGFNLLRDREPDAPITLASDSSLLRVDSLTLSAAVAHAMAHREELRQATTGIQLANAQRRLATSSYLPSLALSASYGIQGNQYRVSKNDDVALANLVFSWNVFSGGRNGARREQATALRNEADLRRRDAERAVRLQVENAYDGVQAARGSLTTAADRLVSAQRAFTLVQRRFAEGLASPLEFLGARSAYTSAAINQIITRFTFATRVVELERAAALRTLPE
ncbi:MAG: TolC family protein [Gemmatimonadaceae bacterium]|nr:TolC family protein [Gemmatimonadaceae bacterium]